MPRWKEGVGDLKVLTDSKAALEVLDRVSTGTIQPFDDTDSVAECNRKFTQAEVDAAERYAVSGGKTAREIAEQLKIDSLGGVDNAQSAVQQVTKCSQTLRRTHS